jgi:hypothetical protein
MAKKLAVIAGIVFVLVGVVGFLNNPLASSANPDALFQTDALHNIVHLLFGIALLIASRTASAARNALIVSGVLYLLLAVVGFVQFGSAGEGKLLGLVQANGADNWLHLVLGLVLLGAGFASKANAAMTMDTRTM